MDAIAGMEQVVRLSSPAVDAHAVFPKDFSNVADGKLLFEKVLKLFRWLGVGKDDFAHDRILS
ncbi:MAG TPA: hypothetical protein VLA17_13895 [Candidatus Limnocylindria bacterium]|nr:hypothetical protein [Candidatus Limnocylindria bacterium]